MQSACAIFSSVSCLSLPYFSTLSRKRLDFRGKNIEYEIVFLFSVQLFFFSATLLILRITNGDVLSNVRRSSCKIPAILARF